MHAVLARASCHSWEVQSELLPYGTDLSFFLRRLKK